MVSLKLIVSLLNVLSWCCFKWIFFLLQTCSHTYCVSSSLLGQLLCKGFLYQCLSVVTIALRMSPFGLIYPKVVSFSRKKFFHVTTVLKVYILLLASFKCLGQSCKCLRFLEQCLGYLFELVTVHGLLLLGSIVHQECFSSFISILFKTYSFSSKVFKIPFQTLVTNNQTSGWIEICPVFLFSSASKLNKKCVSCL